MKFWVVGLAISLLLILLWRIWFQTSSSFARIRVFIRGKPWKAVFDEEAQCCRIEGKNDQWQWVLELKSYRLSQILQLAAQDFASTSGWFFLKGTNNVVQQSLTPIAKVFTGRLEESWIENLSQAELQPTGDTQFDALFNVMGTRQGGELSEAFKHFLSDLSTELPPVWMIIRGQNQLCIRVEGARLSQQPILIQKLLLLAERAMEGWRLP